MLISSANAFIGLEGGEVNESTPVVEESFAMLYGK